MNMPGISSPSVTGLTCPVGETKMEVSFRRRINVATSVKGVKTFEVTVESDNASREELLAESDALVKALDSRYLAQTGGAIDTTWEPNK